MQVTDVRIRRIQTDGKLRAYVSITFDDSFVVHDLRIIDGKKGMFVAMPSKLLPNGNHKDIANPINTEVREMIQNAVLKEYQATEQEAKLVAELQRQVRCKQIAAQSIQTIWNRWKQKKKKCNYLLCC